MTSYTDEMGSEEADKIMQYLGTTNESVIVEADSGRGRLVLNLALKSDHCRKVIRLATNSTATLKSDHCRQFIGLATNSTATLKSEPCRQSGSGRGKLVLNLALKSDHCCQAGSGRGKLVLNLALKSDHCRQVIALEPNLDQLVLASKIAAPLQHNHILACPLKFNCCEIAEYHYINATHVILQNAPSGSGGVMSDPTACRVLVEKLAASPVFKLLVTTSPLPIQASLVKLAASPVFKLLVTTSPLPIQASLVHLGEFFIGSCEPDKAQMYCHLYSHSHPNHTLSPVQHLGEFLLGTCGPDKARMYCHLYSTSFENAPIGTIAQLYSKDGICVLPRANLLKSMSVSARSPTQHLGEFFIGSCEPDKAQMYCHLYSHSHPNHTLSPVQHLGEFLLGTCGPDKARMYCHLYSTSFENAPIGTIAQLYSKDGICVLPRANLLKSMSVSARSPTQVISTPPEVGVRQLSTPNDICGGQADGSVLPQSSQALPSQRSVMSLPPFASGLAGLLHWRGDEDMSMLQ
eukprot:gene11510-34223_t